MYGEPIVMKRRLERHALCVVEAAYRLVDDTVTWLDAVLGAAAPMLDADRGIMAYTYEVTADRRVVMASEPRCIGAPVERVRQGIDYTLSTAPETTREMFLSGPPIVALRNAWPSLEHRVHPDYRPLEHMARFGLVDCTAVKGYDPTGVGLVICAMMGRVHTLEASEVEVWGYLRAHLLAGLRLRQALLDEAILEPDGRVVHAEGEARASDAREALRRRAQEIDRARTAHGRSDPAEALRAWQGLVSGRWSLIDSYDSDGRRYLVARRNDPDVAMTRPLSRRERQVLAYVSMGYSNKQIAYTLGLAPSTVSSHLRSAMRRVGAKTIAMLTELWSAAATREQAGATEQPDPSPDQDPAAELEGSKQPTVN